MNNIRNFCIIAHIDHGKSTLADRFLEMTGTVEKRKVTEQMMDTMELEQERGITIKLQPATMLWHRRRLTRTETPTNADEELLYKDITYKIRGAAFKVKKELGLGHKESVYHKALEKEFTNQGISFESEKRLNIKYDGESVGTYQPDFVIEDKIVVELKALPKIGKPQQEQLWSYLKGGEHKLAMMINFGSTDVEFKRIVFDSARKSSYELENAPRQSASSQRESAGVSNQIQSYTLNLIDTPGHVDFGYEVSRSLAAVEGAVLLVDSSQGVQAQTLANLYQAIEHDLEIIPVLNKIDLPNANVEKTTQEIVHILGCKPEDVLKASGKTGEGVEDVLSAIVEKIPPPKSPLAPLYKEGDAPLRALIFDSKYDSYKGVLAYVRIVDGQVKAEDDVRLMAGGIDAHVIEVGKFSPELKKTDMLKAGDIGYIATGLKSVVDCRVGDTITTLSRTRADFTRTNADREAQAGAEKGEKSPRESVESQRQSAPTEPLEGYKEVKPMVYASFYPTEGEDYNRLRDALDKLQLNDAALKFEGESSAALGRGFRIGFLGLLHLEIIKERLSREFGFEPVITTPSVVYEVEKTDDSVERIYSAAEMPEANFIKEIREPHVKLDVVSPVKYMGSVMELVRSSTRAAYISTEYIDDDRVVLSFDVPLSEVIVNLHDGIKSATSGFASFSYELTGNVVGDLAKLDVYVAEEKVEAFSQIVPKQRIEAEGNRIVKKLKDVIPRQNFLVKLQAAVGAKFVARENITPFRKDVTGHLYGGDITRKRKLLEKQKKGKKRMKGAGKVDIPQKAFLEVLKK